MSRSWASYITITAKFPAKIASLAGERWVPLTGKIQRGVSKMTKGESILGGTLGGATSRFVRLIRNAIVSGVAVVSMVVVYLVGAVSPYGMSALGLTGVTSLALATSAQPAQARRYRRHRRGRRRRRGRRWRGGWGWGPGIYLHFGPRRRRRRRRDWW